MKVLEKLSRTSLAVLLAAFVCYCPLDPITSAEPAFAESSDGTSFDVANTEDFKAAMDTINSDASADGGSYTINIVADFELTGHTRTQHHLMPAAGKTITIIGNGHTIAYQTNTSSQLALGAVGGTLNLGKADGSDSLTIALHATDTDDPLLIAYDGGTINMYDGVTLTGNVNRTGLGGGAVDVQNGTFNMYGGTISDCCSTVVTYGGAVCLQGGTFNMSGGTIKGCHEEFNHWRHGFGGAVAVGMSGKADQFNMSGDAVIDGCKAEYGGGVYINSGSMKMSDNATIQNCEAEVVDGNGGLGGGVYVNAGATFDMSGNATITGNSAVDGGGIISWGTVTATAVHNNTASNSGDDIYNAGTITIASAKDKGWTLDSDNTAIDGWYYDGHRETGETDEQGNAIVDKTRWNAAGAAAATPDEQAPESSQPIQFMSLAALPNTGADDAATTDAGATGATATPEYAKEFTNTDVPTNEVMALKAAHASATTPQPSEDKDIDVYWDDENGTVLYEMDDVAEDDVPAPGEYNELTGRANPTKASDDTYRYVFAGWDESTEPDGDVVYTAEYLPIPKTGTPTTPTTDEPTSDPTPTPKDETPTTPRKVIVPTPIASNGNPTPATPQSTAGATRTKSNGGLTQTGDENDILAYGLIAGIALSGAGLAFARRKLSQSK